MTCKSCIYIDHIGQQIDEIKERVQTLEDSVRELEKNSVIASEKVKNWSHTFQLIATVVLTSLLNGILKWVTKGG